MNHGVYRVEEIDISVVLLLHLTAYYTFFFYIKINDFLIILYHHNLNSSVNL